MRGEPSGDSPSIKPRAGLRPFAASSERMRTGPSSALKPDQPERLTERRAAGRLPPPPLPLTFLPGSQDPGDSLPPNRRSSCDWLSQEPLANGAEGSLLTKPQSRRAGRAWAGKGTRVQQPRCSHRSPASGPQSPPPTSAVRCRTAVGSGRQRSVAAGAGGEGEPCIPASETFPAEELGRGAQLCGPSLKACLLRACSDSLGSEPQATHLPVLCFGSSSCCEAGRWEETR